MEQPLVSVIICTRDRPESFRRALASVLAQDTDGYEVIVVDGSDPPVVVPADTRVPIRVVQCERHGEGRARAAGLRAAAHELVAWCDDDDEWASDHLLLLRDVLLAEPEVALVHARDAAARPPEEPAAPPGFAIRAGDVLHRAAAARAAGGFDHSLLAYAAGDLWVRVAERRRLRPLDRVLATHHTEPGPTRTEERVAALERLRPEWEYAARRTGAARERIERRGPVITPFNPATWTGQRRELIFQTVLKGPGSYPIVARALFRALMERGVQVTLGPLREGPVGKQWRGIDRPLTKHDAPGLVYDFRTGAAELHSERTIYYSVWETTVIPVWVVEEINAAASLVYAACHENARIARANGVKPPVRVLHHGVDPERFPLLERPRDGDEPFTFGSNGVLTARKGMDVLMRAFEEEFAPHEPVRLVLKHSYNRYTGQTPRDPRISLTHAFLDGDDLLEFLRGLDAYVLPSRGEGFGLTGLEAMATGLPLIATDWSGPADYLDPADTFPLRYRLEETGGPSVDSAKPLTVIVSPAKVRSCLPFTTSHKIAFLSPAPVIT
jgi:glycosyltransferase involved in cell wall biosynthesis